MIAEAVANRAKRAVEYLGYVYFISHGAQYGKRVMLVKIIVGEYKMKKSDFIECLVHKTGETTKKTEQFYKAFWQSIEEQLHKGKEVCLTGIGTFKMKKRESRTSINPATKKTMHIPERQVIVFKPSKSFSERVNG